MKTSIILSILGFLTSIQLISSASIEKFSTSQITLHKTPPDVIPNSYILEFNGSPPKDQSETFMNSFVKSIKNEGINYKVRETFNQKIFNGVSIKLDNDKDIEKIKGLKCVKNVWPVVQIQRTEFKIEDNNNNTNSQNLRDSIGLVDDREQSGSEVKVGILDTGIDYKHPALGGCFKTEGCKVQFGFDFVGDDFNGSNDPKPDDDPLDECVGHGTHAAGIIAGEDSTNNFTGIAPKAKLGAYRIFGCNGTTTNDIVIKAMEKAFEDKMNIINLSLVSGNNAWFGSPESLVAEKLTQNGIFVVAPAGTSGDKGIFKVSSPSTAPGVISVASVDTDQINSFFIQPSCDPNHKIQYLTQSGDPIQLENSFSIVPTSNVTNSKNDACDAINEDLTGKVALIRKGGCDCTTKINQARVAGATAVVIYNDVSGIAVPEFDSEGISTPVAMISCEDGVTLFNHIQKDNNLTVQFPSENVLINNPSTLKISAFSSFGPSNELDIKPDIAAPGKNIKSIFPVSLGSFKSISGTSVSAPFVTGALALYMQNMQNGEKSNPEIIRNVIRNNAKPITIKISEGNKTSLVASTILQQGSGLINLSDALSSTIVTSPSKLSLNDSANFNGKKRCLTLTNIGKETTKFTFNHLPAQSINGYDGVNLVPADSPITTNSFANVKFSKSSIRLRPGESQDITLSFTPPEKENEINNSLYSGYIVITDSLTKKNSYVSYMGMKGCLKNLPILDDQSGAPFIQSGINNQKFTLPEEVLTVSMKGDDIALLGVRMAQGTKILTVDVIPAEPNNVVEPPSETQPKPTETQPEVTIQPTETKPKKTNRPKKAQPKKTEPTKSLPQETDKPTDIPNKPINTPSNKPTETPNKPTKTLPKETDKPTDTPNKPINTPSNKPTDTATETPNQPIVTPTVTSNPPTITPTVTPTVTPPAQSTGTDDDVVTITSTIITTVTPVASATPVAKRSFIKIYKRGNNKLKARAFDNPETNLLVPNSLGTIDDAQFVPRNDNSDNNQILTLQFDGKINKLDGTKDVELPNGQYRLFLAALRPFGDPKKKEDWETFTSSIIEIKRE
ncbi:peptidase S8/S53 domain-containing protein [Glomus cerebriforme]|uniref:Peptidase S8/S53 domain-containing protein n=1 Tax=Glomus cerebriforme TaxID=658196 RepID=A0A397TFA1_9GLOM|nr:peptidase S8/S53 domain-containing protein [Glomus cerebriforme]